MHPILKHFIKHQKIYLIVLSILILILPNFLRWTTNNLTIIGTPSYYYLNVIKNIETPLLYSNPYLSFLSLNFTHHLIIYKLLPFILGILTIFLLINNLNKLGLAKKNQFFLLLFLILSPAFIYTFTILTHFSLIIFLILLGFNFLLNKNKIINYLSWPIFLIIPFFDLFSSFLTLLLLIAYFYLKRESIIKISIIITFISTIFNYQKPFLLGPYHPQNVIIDLFSDLGGLFGISLFLLLLATIGISATWKREKFFINYFFLGFLALLSIYRTSLIIYLNFFIVSLAALGINFLLIREWKIKIIKNLTIFLLLLGIVFSTLSSIDTLSQLNPNIPIKDSLQHMQNETPQYKLIFSHPQDSYLIEYYSDRPAFIHYHDSDFKDREKIVKKALNSTYIEDTFPLFKYNDISHIYISPKTRAELSTEGGLLFLFQNERFKKIYTRNNIEIWEFQ